MLHFADAPMFSQRLRVMQTIAGMLIMGVVFFLGFVLMQQQPQGGQPVFGQISLIAVAVVAMQLPLAFVVPHFQTGMALRALAANPQVQKANDDENVSLAEAFSLMARYQGNMILSFALLEGAAFLGLIAYMIEQHLAGLIVALATLMMMLLQFPLRGRVTRWVESCQIQVEEIRRRG